MLPRRNKLKKKDLIGLQKWISFSSPHLTLRIKEAPQGNSSKFSFVASKKISKKSTIRNKLKRLGYRAIQETGKQVNRKVFCVFFFKGIAEESLSYEKVREGVRFLLIKAGVLP